jgi:hypothetical protein
MSRRTVIHDYSALPRGLVWPLGIAIALSFASQEPVLSDPPSKVHWAFSAPVRPPLPPVRREDWVRTPIDRFILARLEAEGLAPSEEADSTTLLRRLSLDLIGLPPSLAELDAFQADPRPDADIAAIERLLASPHHGERWGRLWLDAARYADSNGYEKDRAREMWHWRDWVVRALNDDMPYDQFLIEQFAGDLIPNATQDQNVATGFLRNSMINEEGAIDPEQFRMDAMFDRMDCVGKSVLGLTLQCSQCHDHKYDPLTQREYYQVFAFLNNDDELTTPFYAETELERVESVRRGVREIEDSIRARLPDFAERIARFEEGERRRHRTAWTVLEPYEHGDPGGLSKLTLQADRSLLAGGHRFQGGTWRVRARTPVKGIRAIRLELLTDGNLPHRGPGRSSLGLFALREVKLEAVSVTDPQQKVSVAFSGVVADFEEPSKPEGATLADPKARLFGPARFAADGEERTAWTIDAGPGRRNTEREAVFTVKEPFGFDGGTDLTFHFVQDDEIACFRLSVTDSDGAAPDPLLPLRAREALETPKEKRSESDENSLFTAWRLAAPEFAEENRRIEDIWKLHPEASGSALVFEARTTPRETRALRRGNWLEPLEAVAPGVPGFLHPFPEEAPRNRLGFARWLVDPRSPTTARVIVNRIWQAYFGVGLLATVEDFGKQAPAPSHPELLDWLACELMDPSTVIPGETGASRRWSLKHVHRLIASSAVYRQSSRVLPVHLERDPRNRFLARAPRQRVDAELVRDIALATSGLLAPTIGGPSIYSPAPEFLFRPPTSYSPFPWSEATGASRYRRGFYTFRRRSTPYPVFQAFDAPSGDTSCVRRTVSNTPLQALVTLNEVVFVEAARALARKALDEGGVTDQARLTYAFRRATARHPNERELGHLLALLEKQRRRLSAGEIDAIELATGSKDGSVSLPDGVAMAELAALTTAARVILNLDETITKE